MHGGSSQIRRRTGSWAVLLAALVAPSAALAQGWETVGTGVEYRQFTLPDPNNVFVARMDRSNLQVTIESSIATGKLVSGTETVRSQATRYDQAISYWGQSWGGRNDVVVAINGDFFDASGYPYGGQVHSGWYAKRFGDMGGGSGFAWKIGRQAFIGQCVTHRDWKQYVTFVATGVTQEFQGINRARTTDDLVVYTPQYDATTLTNNSGVEVVVEMTNPSRIMPPPSMTRGFVREIRDGQGSTYIPFDHVVLSATGTKRTTLLANVHVGDEIGISQEISHYEQDCNTPLALDWTKTFASIGGSFYFLKDGVVPSFTDPGATERHPRTAICLDATATYVYFVVVDGRDPGVSVGMSMAELGTFARDTLGVTQCLNQDGGGSSTMVVNGVARNNPSDGSERAVANGMMMVVVEPVEKSTAFAVGDPVTTVVATAVRLGPGTNYEARGSVSAYTAGTVLAHFNGLDGVRAKGSYWWKVDFAGLEGWVPEESVTGQGVPPPGFVVESRPGGLHFANYSDTRMGDSSLKSTAPGTTSGIGSREGELKCAGPRKSATFTFTPGTTAEHEVFATWAASGVNGSQVEHIVTHDAGSTSRLLDQTTGAHAWNSLGLYRLTAGNAYSVTVTNASYCAPSNSSAVFRADAVRWEERAGNAAPTVSIVEPADGARVSGTVGVRIDASDAEDAAGTLMVEVSVDAVAWPAAYDATTGSYELDWDTTTVAEGAHSLVARATDSGGSTTASAPVNVTVDNAPATTMHVGDLDGAAVSLGSQWRATVTITVHDTDHGPVAGAIVGGSWSAGQSGSNACTTDASGRCAVDSGGLPKKTGSVVFTVESVTGQSLAYQSADNHDPDGSSDGTLIAVSKGD